MKGRLIKWGDDEDPGGQHGRPDSEDAPAADFPEVWEAGSEGDIKIKIAITPQGFDKPDEFETTMSIDQDINKHVFIAYSHIFQTMEVEALLSEGGASIEIHNGIEWNHFKSVVTLDALVDDLIENLDCFKNPKDLLRPWERDLAKSLEKVRQALAELEARPDHPDSPGDPTNAS